MNITPVELNLDEGFVTVMNKHYSHALDKHTDSFPEATKSTGDFVYASYNWYHTTGMEILNREKPHGHVLYVACGFGFGIVLTKDMGYSVEGIDINDSHVQECTNRGLAVTIDDAMATEFPKDSFDISLSKDFLRWDYLDIEDIIKCLKEQHRILREGGRVISYSITQGIKDSLWPHVD